MKNTLITYVYKMLKKHHLPKPSMFSGKKMFNHIAYKFRRYH